MTTSQSQENLMSMREQFIFVGGFLGFCGTVAFLYLFFMCIFRRKADTSGSVIAVTNVPEDIENKELNVISFLNTSEKNIDCSVCLDTDTSGAVRLTLCGHKFHENCIHSLETCPMCRAAIANTQQEL